MKSEEKLWTPIRRGKIYCAPRCGFDCTFAAYESCVKKADTLCARLGSGWKPRVWENCGWLWEVSRGLVHLKNSTHKGEPTSYSAWLQTSPQIITEHFDTPEEALFELQRLAQSRIGELSRTIRLIQGASISTPKPKRKKK